MFGQSAHSAASPRRVIFTSPAGKCATTTLPSPSQGNPRACLFFIGHWARLRVSSEFLALHAGTCSLGGRRLIRMCFRPSPPSPTSYVGVCPQEGMVTLYCKYHQHKNHAKKRGIAFKLSFKEWIEIWYRSVYLLLGYKKTVVSGSDRGGGAQPSGNSRNAVVPRVANYVRLQPQFGWRCNGSTC